MSMVFCRGCGKEIHESALACPHCGAPQSALAVGGNAGESDAFLELAMQPLKKYADFQGRARRKEYWYFILICGVLGGVLGAINTFLYAIFWLGVLIPSIAAGVRRLHDTDRSGWWLIVPIVGFVFLCLDGQPGLNRFGASPK